MTYTADPNHKTWQKPTNIKVGDIVSYADVNLWQERGTVTDIGPTEHGGDITVTWTRNRISSEEVIRNLVIWPA